MITEAIILAGGLGTRLKTVTGDTPKCMAPVNGTPFINFLITHLKNEGIQRFIFSLGYKADIITDFIETEHKQLEKVYVIENEQLGTGGAIKEACKNVTCENVIVLNGDSLFSVNLQELADIHVKVNAECTLALKPMQNFSRYGVVETNTSAVVTAFNEKKNSAEGLINGGVYVLQAEQFLQHSFPEKFSFEKEYLEKHVPLKKIYGIAFDNYFIDIGIPEDYERAGRELNISS